MRCALWRGILLNNKPIAGAGALGRKLRAQRLAHTTAAYEREYGEVPPAMSSDEYERSYRGRIGNRMVVHVRSVMRCDTLALDMASCDTVFDLKEKLQDLEGVPANEILLIFAGKYLENKRTLADYAIPDEATMHMARRLHSR